MILGITGTDGAGKGTVVEYLVEKKGFTHFSARAIWIELLQDRHMETNRANMRLIANEMREKYGNDFLITYYLEKIRKEKTPRSIIDSLRAVAEVDTLKAHGGLLIAVDAEQTVRYARIQERNSETDQVSFTEFAAHELLEANDPNPHGMQKQKVLLMADVTLMNNGSIKDLHTAVEDVLAQMGMSLIQKCKSQTNGARKRASRCC